MASNRGSSTRSKKSHKRSGAEQGQLSIPSTRYLFFGGKGGVGKTTSASATALFLLSKASNHEAILLFSTDPAHSLSDSLDTYVGNRLVEISRRRQARLFAYEMDATVALEKFRHNHGAVLAEIAARGTFLDETDINELLNLSLPGLDEVMALFELSELDRSGVYSRVVVDTAPSGHTTRLLRLPEVFKRISNTLDVMAEKHRYIVTQFARRGRRLDQVDLFLRDLNERIDRVQKLLFDEQLSSFLLVAIPEAMSVMETMRYVTVLKSEGVPLSTLIINRVEREHAKCPYCRARVAAQRPWLKKLVGTFDQLQVLQVPLLAQEVRGLESLTRYSRLLWLKPESAPTSSGKVKQSKLLNASVGSDTGKEFLFPLRRLLIFGGKGGVGKTTAAASAALALADANPDKRILVFSTDPAHSLADSYNEPVGELKKRVAGMANLDGMEIDPSRWFEDLKQRYRTWIDELFTTLQGSSRFEVKFEHEAMRELVELTPPGIDEIAALSAVTDLLEKDEYDIIVLDTAPTGHLIRFLELPHAALSWVKTFIKLLLKYQQIVHANRIAEELVTLSRGIKTVLALLTDAAKCEFVAVAIPERMSLNETVDLAESLQKLKIPFSRLLINGVVPDQAVVDCSFCRMRRNGQDNVLKEFRRRFNKKIEWYVAPQQAREVQGAKQLRLHFASWRGLTPARSSGSLKSLQRSRSAMKNMQPRAMKK